MKIKYSKDVDLALKLKKPILALESTIITHGMPYPKNLEFALEAVEICIKNGVTPAIVALLNGQPTIGLEPEELKLLSGLEEAHKISRREIGIAITKGWSGGTTVSATMHISNIANIKTFSTGGIGGVHFGGSKSFDISQDLFSLSNTSQIVISAGIKAVLDIPKTFEHLETLGVTVVGYKTKEVPSFYSRQSGITNLDRVNSANEIINIFNNNFNLGISSSTLVFNPIPEKHEIPKPEIDSIISEANKDLEMENVTGKNITPYLLSSIVKKTNKRSLAANIFLALNNVFLGCKIAKKLNP